MERCPPLVKTRGELPGCQGDTAVVRLAPRQGDQGSPMITVLSVPYQVTRLAFDTGQPYEKFRSRCEAAVPPVDPRRLRDFAGRHARWLARPVPRGVAQPSIDASYLLYAAGAPPPRPTWPARCARTCSPTGR